MSRILIIEDESIIRGALRRLLERHGHEIREAESIEAARELGPLDDQDLIITDIRLPGADGTEIIGHTNGTPVLVMTSYASVSSAVEAMKRGAADYIAKPFDHAELLQLVNKALAKAPPKDMPGPEREDGQGPGVNGMIGRCQAMVETCNRISKVAPTDATVLILGESGTGKELVARALHKHSRRAAQPFVVFNCAAVPEQRIEQELFGMDNGHDGAGLMSKASGGTLFLDEVGELPLPAQARLLRIIQGDEPGEAESLDIRIVAATHRDIRQLVQEQAFRSDLYFRLRVVEMSLPPLRERGDDVIELAVHLLNRATLQVGLGEKQLTREALESIRRYDWPGNVRELANTMERAAILCEGDRITPDLLAIDHQVATRPATAEVGDKLSLEEYFRRFLLEHQDQMTETDLAQRLGISRKALWERRQRFGIPRSRK